MSRAQGWSTRRIALVLYPFGAGAAGVNVFFAALIFSWVGGPVLSTGWSIVLGCVLGVPATWYFARHIRHLMDLADAEIAEQPEKIPRTGQE
ncbi:MAG: NnrT protein [Sediminimonas qiaohouensis]|uniref:NnrT protein n=1 Tax=Sediminimonas qiaohouensis TaxID=552061 RepID=A0A7C9HCF4_9RHOB|nr:NnrT protein [Sediminimonas qiaohouensis]MTJ06004.1 NnrT protein [Sediminimonas qiaohouensis]